MWYNGINEREELVFRMKKRILPFVILLVLSLLLPGCAPTGGQEADEPVWLQMNTDYAVPTTLPDGGGKRVKVVLLLGQSNATGCGLNSYLEKNLGSEAYATYAAGFPSVLINYCLDDHKSSSGGEFVPVDMTCGAADGYFGPEVGMAETLVEAYGDETVVLLKYSMSGYSLHYHWLSQGARGSIYEAFLKFATTYMAALQESHYDARIGAICWMQGESDTTDFKAERYYDNQTRLAAYLREDLSLYAEEGGIYFIDAGISNSPYCEPAYPAINAAKEQFAADSSLNLYFSTIDEGLTVHLEPEGNPDWGHYDSMSVLHLGRLFGECVVRSYRLREERHI
jgi:hypothetical protein